ncbi:hypothetical protein SH601_14230 [Gracilibacillus sp. S3-1-1]|uniref:Uncharacterized protein n=1 Tax=Gracilibacillus pellucidus TaxID=3095368 RepID=A0ACC6M8D9_9BACI|nr:hypothetical protein [Gracilibacillus sp. S3-1-1]MDX8047146.1 hypothetical protein [Gracilibacillus sp. S3-1-1]
MSKAVCLLSVIHDPKEKIIEDLREVIHKISVAYIDKLVCISDQTTKEIVNLLEDADFNVKIIPKQGAANARRSVVQFASDRDYSHYHYCDLWRFVVVQAD